MSRFLSRISVGPPSHLLLFRQVRTKSKWIRYTTMKVFYGNHVYICSVAYIAVDVCLYACILYNVNVCMYNCMLAIPTNVYIHSTLYMHIIYIYVCVCVLYVLLWASVCLAQNAANSILSEQLTPVFLLYNIAGRRMHCAEVLNVALSRCFKMFAMVPKEMRCCTQEFRLKCFVTQLCTN